MIGGHALHVSLMVRDDHAVSQRIQSVLCAQLRKQLHSCLIGSLGLCLRCGFVQYRKGAAAGVFDLARLRHLYAHMGVVGVPGAVPAPIIPWKALIYRAVCLKDRMYRHLDPAAVPLPCKDLRAGLCAAHAVEHQPFRPPLLEGRVPAVCLADVVLIALVVQAVVFNQLHCCHPPFYSDPAPPLISPVPDWDWPCIHSPRCCLPP